MINKKLRRERTSAKQCAEVEMGGVNIFNLATSSTSWRALRTGKKHTAWSLLFFVQSFLQNNKKKQYFENENHLRHQNIAYIFVLSMWFLSIMQEMFGVSPLIKNLIHNQKVEKYILEGQPH